MKPTKDEMRSEYDFSGGVRGKYAVAFAGSSNVVMLESDVAKVFKTSKAVNAALRMLMGKAKRSRRR